MLSSGYQLTARESGEEEFAVPDLVVPGEIPRFGSPVPPPESRIETHSPNMQVEISRPLMVPLCSVG